MSSLLPPALVSRIQELAGGLEGELRDFRRDLHAHPEIGHAEHRTTRCVADRLAAAGLSPVLLPGSGLTCDLGDPQAPAVALRADLDALPVQEVTGLPWSSTVPGACHACGHDLHTTALLGAGLILSELAGSALPHRVRLVFQPAEEITPGGAMDVVGAGALEGVRAIYGLHCDPHLDAGEVGLRVGPITAAFDQIVVRFAGEGGHTSRPHLTGDLVYAMGEVITRVPAILGRRIDPRSGVNLTWGAVHAGQAANAIPSEGVLRGTLRCMDTRAWEVAGQFVRSVVAEVVAPLAVEADVDVRRGVPPVDNDPAATSALEHAARAVLGEQAVQVTEQSMGGEDFAWYLRHVPGAMARLGTRTPGGRTFDLHQGNLVVDEAALGVGTRLLAALALQPCALPGLDGAGRS